MDKPTIHAKVAAIVTPTSLVINRGESHGVRQGMKFGVYYSLGPITDPDDPTNILNELTFRKGTIEVTRVYPRMAFCLLQPAGYKPGPHDFSVLSGSLFPKAEAIYPPVAAPMYQAEDYTIRVGDQVAQIVEEPAKEKKP